MENWDVLSEDFEQVHFEDRFTLIVIYDIISNKRRTRLAKLLQGFGYRIQKSAFECVLTREKCEKLFSVVAEFAQEDDLIRIYQLNQYVKSVIYGEASVEENEEFYFF